MSDSIIQNLDMLRALYPDVNPNSLAKEVDHLNPVYRAWLSQAQFFVLASTGPNGLDCSPRGDGLGDGFLIADDKTLLIPDRRGNNRLDSLQNIITDPNVSLIFFIPGVNETLRMRGRAEISIAPELLEQFEVSNKKPLSVIRFSLDTAFFQCGRALVRSGLWQGADRPKGVPTAGQMLQSAIDGFDGADYDAKLPQKQSDTLY